MKKNFSRVLSGVLAVMIAVPNLMQLAASAEEGEKSSTQCSDAMALL